MDLFICREDLQHYERHLWIKRTVHVCMARARPLLWILTSVAFTVQS